MTAEAFQKESSDLCKSDESIDCRCNFKCEFKCTVNSRVDNVTERGLSTGGDAIFLKKH